jgi:hypothetical protein
MGYLILESLRWIRGNGTQLNKYFSAADRVNNEILACHSTSGHSRYLRSPLSNGMYVEVTRLTIAAASRDCSVPIRVPVTGTRSRYSGNGKFEVLTEQSLTFNARWLMVLVDFLRVQLVVSQPPSGASRFWPSAQNSKKKGTRLSTDRHLSFRLEYFMRILGLQNRPIFFP